ncbi:hypothetical protein EB796_015185 [Bugula neritina]|uniref:Nonsense-mediated mRNA decay factor SMG8 n=1 Tax=Bugula neritina TaxID=10212 RepID=A0A7J7JM45_BUGNE|nr:hypothetical protein EB796_015185 [Bugula neritina]
MDKFFTFSFPEDLNRFNGLTNDKSVCVVAIIGKTAFGGSKSSVFTNVLDHHTGFDEGNKVGQVRGCYDATRKLVVLECFTGYDIDQLSRLLLQGNSSNFDSVLFTKAKIMLYAFHVAHIILLSTPGLAFDTSYIRLFRALDHARNKLHLEDELKKFDLPKSWCLAGRPVCPRLLFLFNPVNKHLLSDATSIRKKQDQLEDVIYRVLRKTRIITNNPKSALFALPANQQFVHIMSANEGLRSKENIFKLFDLCLAGEALEGLKADDSHLFKEMLMQHVDLVHGPGFDDSIGRNPVSNPCNVAKLDTWLAVASQLYTLIVKSAPAKGDKSRLHSVFTDLKSTIEIEQRFSDSRCLKVLQFADKAYRENLPEHYTEGVHHEQLAKAQHVMLASGRGPALQSYLARIKRDCTKYWENGHRLCESSSLSGSHCIHQLHRLPNEPITEDNEKLPCSEHSTSVSFTVACNCGRTLNNIGDPFTAKEANYLVYEDMSKGCCSKLQNIPFPVYVAAPVSPPFVLPRPLTLPRPLQHQMTRWKLRKRRKTQMRL